MIQDILANNDNIHANDKQMAILKEHFPACFSKDGAFDIERFKEEIKDKTDITTEGYELKFLGKSYAKLLASTETTTVIVPDEEHNQKPENKNSENIYISGDNLDGLKHLLHSYQKKIKCIYIDPPYNTGSDGFVYNDSFNYTSEELQEKLSIGEKEAQRILDLTKRGSASHSAWLMFMYPRLLLARDLMTDDGVIFISIDDNEQANLKLLCDDIFGEENFQGQFVVNATPNARDYGHIGKMHEFVLFYAKNEVLTETFEIEIKEKTFKFYDSLGGYNIHPLYNSNEKFHVGNRRNLYYPFYVNPQKSSDGFHEISLEKNNDWIEVFPPLSEKNKVQFVWRWGKEKSMENLNLEIVGYITNEGNVRIVQKMRHTTKLIRSVLEDKDYTSRRGTAEVEELFSNKMFDFPKPVNLIKLFLNISTKEDQIILDFFSGSATTAHAVMQLNAEDASTGSAGQRKFIAVQLPEVLSDRDDSQKNAYKFLQENGYPTTLDYIGIERIKRAAAKIKEEQLAKGVSLSEVEALDLGFKHFTLKEPEQNTLDKLESFNKSALIADTTVLDDFGTETVLATWLNDDGYGLTATAEETDLEGYKAYYKDKHLYFIYPDFTQEALQALITRFDTDGSFNPENIVLFGYSFPDWSVNEMLEKNLKILNDSEKNLKINYAVRY